MSDESPPIGGENAFENWKQSRADVHLSEAIAFFEQRMEAGRTGLNLPSVEEKFGQERALVCETALAKGEKPTVVISAQRFQGEAIDLILDIVHTTLYDSRKVFWVDVEKAQKFEGEEPKTIQARLFCSSTLRPPSSTALIISEGLSNQLGLQEGEQIRLSDVYQDLSTVNLDSLVG